MPPRAAGGRAQLPGKVTDPARPWPPSRRKGSAPHPPDSALRGHSAPTPRGQRRAGPGTRLRAQPGPDRPAARARAPRAAAHSAQPPGSPTPRRGPTHRLSGPRSRRGRAVGAHGAHAARGLCTHVTAVAPPPAWPRPARPGTAGPTAGPCGALGSAKRDAGLGGPVRAGHWYWARGGPARPGPAGSPSAAPAPLPARSQSRLLGSGISL